MDTPKLQIMKKRYSGDSTVISLRMPKEMLADLDKIAEFTGRPRNEILTMSLEFALKHMEIETDENDRGVENGTN